MIKSKIEKIINDGENQKVEFKLKINDSLGKSICGFANTTGGIILVGVNDDGKITGINKKHEREIANMAHTCKPSVYPKIETIEIKGKNIFIAEIKKSNSLHSFKNIAYKRIASHNKPLSPEEVIEFAKDTGKIKWDGQVCEEANLNDIDEEKVRWFLRKAKAERSFNVEPETPIKEALERLELVKDKKLTNAAVLLFGKNPQRFFSQAETRCARFKGIKPVKPFLDMKVFTGNIIDQVDKSLNFVLEHIPMKAYLVGKSAREEKYEYPPDAIREAIINAICHRDYEISSNVQVRVFDDKIEIWGCGPLPKSLTLEDLKKKHRSILRNRLIGKCFFLIKFIEQWGTGTNDIIKICLDWGLPEPLFEEVTGSLVVTFRKSKLTEEFLEKIDLNERQKKVIEYLKEYKKMTSKKYSNIFKITERMARNDLKKLADKKIIKRKGVSDKMTYYILAEI